MAPGVQHFLAVLGAKGDDDRIQNLYQVIHGDPAPEDCYPNSGLLTAQYDTKCTKWYEQQVKEAQRFKKNNLALWFYSSGETIHSCTQEQANAAFEEWYQKAQEGGTKTTVTLVRIVKDAFFPHGHLKENGSELGGGWGIWWEILDKFSKKTIVVRKRKMEEGPYTSIEKLRSRMTNGFNDFPIIRKARELRENLHVYYKAAIQQLIVRSDGMAHEIGMSAWGADYPEKRDTPKLVCFTPAHEKKIKGIPQSQLQGADQEVLDEVRYLPSTNGRLTCALDSALQDRKNGIRNPYFHALQHIITQYIHCEETAAPEYQVYYGENGSLTVSADEWQSTEEWPPKETQQDFKRRAMKSQGKRPAQEEPEELMQGVETSGEAHEQLEVETNDLQRRDHSSVGPVGSSAEQADTEVADVQPSSAAPIKPVKCSSTDNAKKKSMAVGRLVQADEELPRSYVNKRPKESGHKIMAQVIDFAVEWEEMFKAVGGRANARALFEKEGVAPAREWARKNKPHLLDSGMFSSNNITLIALLNEGLPGPEVGNKIAQAGWTIEGTQSSGLTDGPTANAIEAAPTQGEDQRTDDGTGAVEEGGAAESMN